MPLRLPPKMLAPWLLLLALLAGCSGEASSASSPAASDGSGDGAATSDATGTSDSTGTSDASGDASNSGDTAPASPAQSACAALADAICSGAQSCCGGVAPANCAADWRKACLKLGWADADDSLASGILKKDQTVDTACQQALQAAVATCDRQAASRALGLCLRAWVDPAKLGEACAAPVELACAAGAGRAGRAVPAGRR